ncbi:uncharacterized protein LOC118414459 [Branchiostoma floridae]|uniref:Uncharacterized protein LOC118414459 n=1 Tax=Branchiostoma floridae TaxID=7739 RepID=A0A9J7MP40_BRAFL|nr:uncharacterized protein LOC118414459 [Branchiostoma floridae]
MAVSFWEHKARIAFKPAYNTRPANYHGDLFVPSFNFPAEEPKEDFKKLPWMKIDFKTSPMDYLDTVLHYCFDGNTECDFRVENNGTHPDRWYHAPWMAYPPSGREPIHGLTMERPTEPQYFGLKDQKWLQTWALSFYNDFGAKTISDFWEKPWEPALKDDVTFPPGTVSFKLLFTEATEDDVPSLAGSKEWLAAIGKPYPPISKDATMEEAQTKLDEVLKPENRGPNPYPLRLIQVDVMVKDTRAKCGWVFGTFMYHKDQPGDDPYRKLVPMCLQWGNDPGLTLEETWTHPDVKNHKLLPEGRPYLGWLESSCAASDPKQTETTVTQTPHWFRNILYRDPFEKDVQTSLDYSMQLLMGLYGYNQWRKDNPPPDDKASK